MDVHPNIFPTLRYRDANAAIDFLAAAFGFTEKAVHRGEDGTVQHAELQLGAGLVMVGEGDGRSARAMYIVVSDPDALYAQAVAAGAQITRELTDTDYGSRDFAALDP